MPSPSSLGAMHHQNASAYTLTTVHPDDDPEVMEFADDRAPLLTPDSEAGSSYGATPARSQAPHTSSPRLLLKAAIRMAAVFILSTILLGGTLWLTLPTLDEYVPRTSFLFSTSYRIAEPTGRHSVYRNHLLNYRLLTPF
jgi:hypothetical protein